MKQVFQDVADGRSQVLSVPRPACKSQHVVIATTKSLISAGTERMLVDFSRAGYLEKVRRQPEKVRMVFDKVKSDGLLATMDAVRTKLGEPMAMGYSNVGRVIETGHGVTDFHVGDRVLSNGHHAEIVCVGKNLCARIPDEVDSSDAVFGVVGSIAMQGIRLAKPTPGECFVVIGLGLIGLMAVQLLRASGCRVLGTDFDESKLMLAASYGAETVNSSEAGALIDAADRFSRRRGVDGVLIAASTDSNEPVSQAAQMCRKRGRIVLVGVSGLQLNRAEFYEKEISFQVSCSYGPGRYDEGYEGQGNDYPLGFVRWTEQRNFEAVLDLIASGRVLLNELKSAEFDIDQAGDAYDLLVKDRSALGILINYPDHESKESSHPIELLTEKAESDRTGKSAVVGAIGAGNYAGRVLLPALANSEATLHTVVSSQGVSGTVIGNKVGFRASATDTSEVIGNKEIDTVVIATRHDSHARLVVEALAAGQNVFVEKPLAITLDELDLIEKTYNDAQQIKDPPILMVGFNRRFSRLVETAKNLVAKSAVPKSFVFVVNAGAIAADHWTRDPVIGGGRIIGEGCHFIDLLRYLAGSVIVEHSIVGIKESGDVDSGAGSAIVSLKFSNGSIGSIQYLTGGARQYPKERLEVFYEGKVLRLDNFVRLDGWGIKDFSRRKLWRQDKGQQSCIDAFISAVRNGESSPISADEIFEVGRVSIELGEKLH